jgi:proliferating cell nuclear antigen
MFEITFASAKEFKNSVDALATLIDEGTFNLTSEGITFKAMDPSQIAMVDFSMPKTGLEKYEATAEAKITLNMDDLAKITTRYRSDEKLTLKLDESNTRLILLFKGKSTRRFNLPLLDSSAEPPKTPSIDFDAEIKMSGNALKEGLKDANLVSSHVVLNAKPEGFDIEASGDKGKVLIEAKKDDDILLECAVKTASRAMFPLEYLNDLLKAADASTTIGVGLKTDAPLKISYKIGEATVAYFLAPRIENV